MKNLVFSFITLLAFGLFGAFTTVEPPQAVPAWQIDATHSSVSFQVRHFFSNVLGTFDKFGGKLHFDPADLKGSSVSFEIEVASVNTKDEKRNGHLQSASFFDVEKWPTMSFKSTEFKKGEADNEYVVSGEMTIRDVTKKVELPVKFLGQMDHMMRENYLVGGFSTEFIINRNDYGVGVGDWAATAVIGDEIKVNINLEVNRQKDS